NRRTDGFFHKADISTGIFRQIFQFFGTKRGFFPTRQFFVHRTDFFELIGTGRYVNGVTVLVFVTHAHLDGVQAIQHVQLGQADGVDGVYADGVFYQHGIEPATTTGTAGGGAFFVTHGLQVFADAVKQLSRERARTHAGGISLGDPQNLIQIQRAYAGTGGHTTSGGVGRGNKRIRTVVDVQQCALGTFEHNVAALFTHTVHQINRIHDDVLQLRRPVVTGCQGFFVADFVDAVVMLQ